MRKIIVAISIVLCVLSFNKKSFSQDSNFYVYICFGQSNMEGQGTIESKDETVDSRFKVLQAVDCSNLGRTKGVWADAIPPLTRCYSGLSPADYFGRTMVENLPDSITVGVLNVSVAGCKIELFDKDDYQDYAAGVESWMTSIIEAYDGNPYQYLVDMAKIAQESGVIKGILLHQGESNTGDTSWPTKVKEVYDNLLADLSLNADSVPLFAGELAHADQGGACASMNTIIDLLPNTIPNSYVVSSSGCTVSSDNIHFNSAGYRKIGARYAIQALALMGIEVEEDNDEPEEIDGTTAVYFEAECAEYIGANWQTIGDEDASNGYYVEVVSGTQSLSEAAGDEGLLSIPFEIDTVGNYTLYARVNCPTADDDSYWYRIDNDDFGYVNSIYADGWEWVTIASYNDLEAGEHILEMTYREDGAKLDKLCISNYTSAPENLGDDAVNACEIDSDTTSFLDYTSIKTFELQQNYPNPFSNETTITFEIAEDAYVSLKVFDIRGVEIANLVGEELSCGNHIVSYKNEGHSSGIYFYTLTVGNQSLTKRMNIVK